MSSSALPWLATEILAAGLLLGVAAVALIIVPVKLVLCPEANDLRRRQRQPVSYVTEQEKPEHGPGHQAGRDQPLP